MRIKDIAELSGVSVATVSRYLNGGGLSDEKRERIKKVIEETGYAPNPTAQWLRKKEVNSIGVIVPKINSESISNVISGISSVLNENNFMFFLGNTDNDEKRELDYLKIMQENRLAGIILLGTFFTSKHIKMFKECKIPLVICGQKHPNVSCVYHDDKGAAKELAAHIIKKGRKKLAYIGVTEKDISVGLNRRMGVEEAMLENGLDKAELSRVQVGFSSEDGYDGMKKILDSGFVPDGVICATDTIAIGAILALEDAGFSIPADVSIGGIGGNKAGTIVRPKLTTVSLFHRESGVKSAELLLSMIENIREDRQERNLDSQTKLGYSFTDRESV